MRGFRSAGRFQVRGDGDGASGSRAGPASSSLALVMLPMLMGAGSASGQAPMPTVAGIRGAVVRLADWVTGRTPPKPGVPEQQAGKAPGKQHQVPAAVTRAVARAPGRAPGKGAGQLPAYTFPAAKVKRHVTGAADLGGAGSFSPATSKLVPSGTTATSELYRNADGSYTRLEYPAAVNRRDASGAWVPIGTASAGGASSGQPAAGSGGGAAAGTLAFSGPSGVGVKGTHVTSASLLVRESVGRAVPGDGDGERQRRVRAPGGPLGREAARVGLRERVEGRLGLGADQRRRAAGAQFPAGRQADRDGDPGRRQPAHVGRALCRPHRYPVRDRTPPAPTATPPAPTATAGSTASAACHCRLAARRLAAPPLPSRTSPAASPAATASASSGSPRCSW